MSKVFLAIGMLLFMFHSEQAKADASALCYGCSESDKSALAKSYALDNISPNEAKQGVKKTFHVIDMVDGSVTTFEAYKIYKYLPYLNPPTSVYRPAAIPIVTSAAVISKASELKQTLTTLSKELNTITIPANIIDSAWEFPNCSYCANDISDYLNSHSDVTTGFTKVEKIMNWLNIVKGKLNEVWILDLAVGGKIHVKFNLVQQDNVIVVEIVKVIDDNNNTVRMDPSQWEGRTLKGTIQSDYWSSIQHYLWRFGYTFKPLPDGRVTITECRRPNSPPSNLPECK